MTPRRITSRIVIGTLCALALMGVMFTSALTVVRDRIDTSAEQEAIRYVRTRLEQVHRDFGDIAVDYGHWSEAHEAVLTGDLQWLYDGIGVVADQGDVFDAVMLSGGVLEQPLSWVRGGGATPGQGFLPPELVGHLHRALDNIPLHERDSAHGLIVHNGQLAIIAASHLRPFDMDEQVAFAEDFPVLVGLRILSAAQMDAIEIALTLTDMTFDSQLRPGRSHQMLRDVTGAPIGYLSWETRRPGSEVLAALRPVQIGLIGLVVLLSGLIAALVRSNALHLIKGQEQARALARTDPLTGMANRLAMTERIDAAQGAPVGAVLYLDLNGFKKINDVLGHAAGDNVVKEFALRLLAVCDPGDFVARVGGDEFVILIPTVPRPEARARALARRVSDRVLGTFHPLGQPVHLSAAMGISVRDNAELVPAELVRRADLAMLSAKRARQSAPSLYSGEIEAIACRDSGIEAAMRAALKDGQEFSVQYQPIVAAASGTLIRAEALARWNSPSVGRVPPDLFIPLAEASGQIGLLGALLMERICADMARCPDLSVSINISPLQLLDPEFRPSLMACVARHGISAHRIEIELTESVLVDDPDAAAIRLDALREAGFSTAIDDFGTGFSSLGALRRMPFHTLKIDRQFLSVDGDAKANAELIGGIIRIGHAMGQTIVCEGVETGAQADLLARIGCDLLQGYHFGRPMPIDDLLAAFPAAPGARRVTGS